MIKNNNIAIICGFGLTNKSCASLIDIVKTKHKLITLDAYGLHDVINGEGKESLDIARLRKISLNSRFIILHSIATPLFYWFINNSNDTKNYLLLEPNIFESETSATLKKLSIDHEENIKLLPIIERLHKSKEYKHKIFV